MRIPRRRARIVAFLAAFALVATACGTDDTTEPGDGASPTADDQAQEPTGERVEGGTVVFGHDQEPAVLNSWLSDGNLFATGIITEAVFSAPYALHPDFSYQPELLEDECDADEGPPFVLTCRIKEEAAWSDGEPITWEDVEFTRATIMNEEYDITSRDGWDLMESIEQGENEKEFVITWSEPFAPWRVILNTGLLPKHELEGEDFNTVWDEELTISSGPFQFEEWEKGQSITLTRNDNYWGEPASLDEVIFTYHPDTTTMVQLLRSGEIDMFYPQPQLDLVEQVEEIEEVETQAKAGTVWEHLDFNVEIEGLDQPFVRQALAYAIDRQQIVDEFITPLHADAEPLNNVMYVPVQDEYEAHFDRYAHDPEQARQLLEDNGCTEGDDGIYECDGTRLSFDYVTTAGNELRELQFEVIQAQAREVGIELNADFGEAAVVFGERLVNSDFDMFNFAWVASPDPFSGRTIWICEGDINYNNYCNEEVTELLTGVDSLLDEQERADRYNQADEILAEDVPVLPLYQKPTFFAWRNHIVGPEDNPTVEGPTWNIAEWYLTERSDSGTDAGTDTGTDSEESPSADE